MCAQNVMVGGWLAVKSVASVVSGRLFLGFEKHATGFRFFCGKVIEGLCADKRQLSLLPTSALFITSRPFGASYFR